MSNSSTLYLNTGRLEFSALITDSEDRRLSRQGVCGVVGPVL